MLNIANTWKKKKFHFAISDEEEFAKELESVGLGESGADMNVLCFGADGKKYPADPDDLDDFSEEAVEEYMQKLNTGTSTYVLKPCVGFLVN